MRVLTLTYHDVAAYDGPPSGFRGVGPNHYRLSPASFARHLDAIAGSGLTPSLLGKSAPAASQLFLTFDDGGVSGATTTGPLLIEHQWHGHFFITVERIDTPAFMSAGEIRKLRASGHLIGSHGYTHRTLTKLSDDAIADEWRRSKEVLEGLLEEPVETVSIPTGAYSSRVGRLAMEAGYRHIFTSEPWLRPRRLGEASVYGRFGVVSDTSPEELAALCAFSRGTIYRMAALWQTRKVAKAVLGDRYEALRVRLLARRDSELMPP
jgi:peptidoglycan/xylan/chitin deacetylase (PgdA/CDA1 family)